MAALIRTTLPALDAAGLLADFGFAPRQGFVSGTRLDSLSAQRDEAAARVAELQAQQASAA